MEKINIKFDVHYTKYIKAVNIKAYTSTPVLSYEFVDKKNLMNLFGYKESEIEDHIILPDKRLNFSDLMQYSGIFSKLKENDIYSLFSKKQLMRSTVYVEDILEITTGEYKIMDVINTVDIRNMKEFRKMLELSYYYVSACKYDVRFDMKIYDDEVLNYKINTFNSFQVVAAQYILCNIMKWDKFYKLANTINKEYGVNILFSYLLSRLTSILVNISGLIYSLVSNESASGTIFNNHVRTLCFTRDPACYSWILMNGLNQLKVTEHAAKVNIEFPKEIECMFSIHKYTKLKYFSSIDPVFFGILCKDSVSMQNLREVIISLLTTSGNIVDSPYGIVIQTSYDNINNGKNIHPMIFDVYSFISSPKHDLHEQPQPVNVATKYNN